MVTDEEFNELESRVNTHDSALRSEGILTDANEVIGLLFPDTVDDEKAKEILNRAPEEFYVDSGSGTVSYSGDEFWKRYGSKAKAEADRQLIIDAAAEASSNPDVNYSDWFPENYDPQLVGPGLHAADVGDKAALDDWRDEWGINVHGDLEELVAKQASKIVVRQEPYTVEVPPVWTYVPSSRLSFAFADDEHAQTAIDAANDLAGIIEDAVTDLKNNYPENWDRFFGFTEVDVVVELDE